MSDYLVRGIAANGTVRAFAVDSTNTVANARERHETFPVVTAALGRLLSAGLMMGSMMKGADEILTIILDGQGPIGKVTVTADSLARVKGYVGNPQVMLPISPEGKLDVGGAIGTNGLVTVIKDLGLKEPYVGQTKLISGEVAEDMTVYFAVSEQTPSAVALGVLMNKDNTVSQAGGFIVQLMPDADDELITYLEQKMTEVTAISSLLDEGITPEELINYILEPYEPEILDTIYPEYHCNCSKKRYAKGIVAIGKKDLQEIIDDGEPIEVVCQFCGKKYNFAIEELKEFLKNGAKYDN